MTSQPNQLIVASRLEARTQAASRRRVIRDLPRDSRPAAKAVTAPGRFRRRGIASTPSA